MMNNFAEVKSENLPSCLFVPDEKPPVTPEIGHCILHQTLHSSLDVWEYESGEFDWKAECDQTVWVLSGHGIVVLPDGQEIDFIPGATCFFNRNSQLHWIVDDALRLVAACCR